MIFKKKYPRIEDQEFETEEPQPVSQDPTPEVKSTALSADIIKLKAQFDQFSELRKVINERFTRLNEQVGELRGMIMDTNRSMQDMEVKTVKAVDMVEAVHPDKLMVEVRKQDARIESLKANIESNDSIMNSILDQIKDIRHQISSYRGVDEVVKLNEEVKKELMNIKKSESVIERHADKTEEIFVESQKRFQEYDMLSDKLTEIQRQLSQVTEQADQNKVKILGMAQKKDVENLINKFNEFEKHVGNVIDLLSKRANDIPKDIDQRFRKLEQGLNNAFEKKMKSADAFNQLIENIEKQAPRIATELQISDKLKDVQVKKIESQPSQPTAQPETTEKAEQKKGLMSKIFKKS